MRILHINCNYLGTTLHQLMVEELNKYGIENEVFVPTYDKKISVITPDSNVYVSECFNKWDRLLFDYKQKKIIRAIEQHYDVGSFDLIHAYTLFTDGNAARILSEKYGVPFVVAVRNTDVNTFFKNMIFLRKRGIKTLLKAQKIFFLSKAYEDTVFDKYVPDKYKQHLLYKTEIIPNGIDDFWFRNAYKDRDFSAIENRIGKKRIKLVYAGGIDRNKNITATCRAINKLESEGWSVSFSVVGKIKEQAAFDEIKDKVNYISAKPKEELIALYRDADIFVMPSVTESFGLVYVEAMSQGLPVIYTRGQGFDGHFEDGTVGFAASSSDPDEIARKIEDAAGNYRNLSINATNGVDKFRWEKICHRYYRIYSGIVNN